MERKTFGDNLTIMERMRQILLHYKNPALIFTIILKNVFTNIIGVGRPYY